MTDNIILDRMFMMYFFIIFIFVFSLIELVLDGINEQTLNLWAFVCFVCAVFLFLDNTKNYRDIKHGR